MAPNDTIPPHLRWLVKGSQRPSTVDGVAIEVWDLRHQPDAEVLSGWAKHFRNHYCADDEIDTLRAGTPHSRAEYLKKLKFPDDSAAPGPSIRSGDFGEILIADYIEYVLKYWVPRSRYDRKDVRNESTKGSDILGFKFVDPSATSARDILFIVEGKTQLSGKTAKDILQQAIHDSAKDEIRKAESLNALKQRLIDRGKVPDADKVSRFQSPEDNPYVCRFGAAAVFSSELLDTTVLQASDTSPHPHKDQLSLVVIAGPKLSELVSKLYDIAANEA